MCWYCCISLRGAVYFGTSVHIFVGLVLLVRWVVLSYLAAFVTDRLLSDASVLILTVLSGVYVLLFIILGCLIFAGTERQSVSLLKWSSAGFSILQVLVFTIILVLYLFAPGGWSFLDPEISDEMRILTISMYFCCLVATANYIIVLFLYIRKVWNLKRSHRTSSNRSGSSLHNIRISHPIPHQIASTATTNISSATNPSTNTNPNLYTSTNSTSGGVLPNYSVNYYHHQQPHRRTHQPGSVGSHGPESPGIYESLDTQSAHPFYPANFYSGYSGSRLQGQEGIYNGSIRSGTGSGIYNQNQRPYPYPHQRYREPLLPSTMTTTAIAGTGTNGREAEGPGQDWMEAYGHRLQVFQRGLNERNSQTNEPLLRNT